MTDLQEQIDKARHQIVSDGYEMSIGELVNLYRDEELTINPNYQRLFRWTISQKSRFIESLLLGIPVPPIFVFQKPDGVWELIDGLQRTSTVLEFIGALKDADGTTVSPSCLQGTDLLPSLAGVFWEAKDDDGVTSLPTTQRLEIKRARFRVEILRKESDENAKFELFQRLNTGGSILSEQEVRNCVLVMSNQGYFEWLQSLTALDAFTETVPLTEAALKEQKSMELVLRHIAYRRRPYETGLDVNAYLDKAALTLSRMSSSERDEDEGVFEATFGLLASALGEDAFRKWNGTKHVGGFLISGFDAIAHGVATNLDSIQALDEPHDWLRTRVREVWSASDFTKYSGMGVRGTTRLRHLLPFGEGFFRP